MANKLKKFKASEFYGLFRTNLLVINGTQNEAKRTTIINTIRGWLDKLNDDEFKKACKFIKTEAIKMNLKYVDSNIINTIIKVDRKQFI